MNKSPSRPVAQWAALVFAIALATITPAAALACEHAQQPSGDPPVRQSADTANTLPAPDAVHRRERTEARSDALLVQALEHRLKCSCPCGLDVYVCRTTDFACTYSPAMHQLVLARLDSGMTADQVVAAFETQYGPSVLMAPPKKGFNLSAYVVPFVALGAGLTLLTWFMRRWTRRDSGTVGQRDGTSNDPSHRPAVPPSPDVERLERELQNFES